MNKKSISVEAFAIDMHTYLSITKGIVKSCEIEAGPLGYGCVRLFQVADVLLDFSFTVNMSTTHINMEETNEHIGINCALVKDDDNNYIVLVATNFFNPIETALNRQSLGTLIPKILNKATILATKWLAINGPDITKAEKPAEPAQEYHASDHQILVNTFRVKMVEAMVSKYFSDLPVCVKAGCVLEHTDNIDLARGASRCSHIIYDAKQATGLALHIFGQAYILYDINKRLVVRLGFVGSCSVDNIIHIMKMVVTNHVLTVVDEDE